ncbi:MAG: single-stranded-DNA-specific exonuclease RecJ [Bdellovibrionales bacterium RIFCSPHIGHO2_01_FULL_40_29]|nr:MAG: single-stranded-DNA-specific exonuclease RecJ [Bdellovibrionales bacterium RIFCSPHIGHO2_01_FULL_40_29]OFZ34427.1 MAG: single-stranded-DNA-specific exonuclease RecJ [Bdellovibrionales bacterium RIFCSPHIGHO2_02_FULL_40_15]
MQIWKQRQTQTPKPQGPFPDLIARVLASREISQDNLDFLLQPKLSELKDPLLMLGMQKAVDRLVQAYKNNEKICVYADFDLDGTSGLAILKVGLEKLGFQDVAYYQPKRLSEGYGFHADAVTELHHLGISLIITVDVGITSFKAFERARELGLDVILTDHHLPAEKLPDAFVVVNPNQKDCTSGLGYLCGAGVAFYLLRAAKRAFFSDPDLPHNEWDLKEVLEFFCIGTLTDMVPLIQDNRVLVKHGLLALAQTQKPGLRALLSALKLDSRELTSQDVAIRFAPKLNALSRLENNILPAQIYLETNMQKANQMVSLILENNQTRQNLQGDAEKKAFEILQNWPDKDFVFVSSEFFHRGVVGLIATKLSQHFNCPAFVGSKNSEGMIVGSGRAPNGSDVSLVEVLKSCESVLNRFGGHAAAAGFELHGAKESQMVEFLREYFVLSKSEPKPIQIDFDTMAEVSEINAQAMKWHDFIGPFGMGFQVPLIQIAHVKLSGKKELKGGHLKLSLSTNAGDATLEALLFSPSPAQVSQVHVGKIYQVLVELQWNYFNGNKTIQLLIKDFKANDQ